MIVFRLPNSLAFTAIYPRDFQVNPGITLRAIAAQCGCNFPRHKNNAVGVRKSRRKSLRKGSGKTTKKVKDNRHGSLGRLTGRG
jgi:hypothetical protein